MKKDKKKLPEELKAEEISVSLKEILINKLSENSNNVIVKHLFDDRFRVNVWKEGLVNKSFFIQASENGIISSNPEIK
jgi:hypothetical protein